MNHPISYLPGEEKEKPLGRLFFAFPGGLPGAGLLLIRAVCGVAALIQGVYYVAASHPDAAASFMALVDFGGGGLLLAGFLTPFAALVIGAGLLAPAFSVLSAP